MDVQCFSHLRLNNTIVSAHVSKNSRQVVARNANDPVLAASLNGEGPIVLAWEEGPRKDRRIRVQVVSSN